MHRHGLLLKVRELVWLPLFISANHICSLTSSLQPEYKPISGGYIGTGKHKYLLNKYLLVYPNKYLLISTYACQVLIWGHKYLWL